MAKIPETFNVGDRSDLTLEELLRLMEQMYTQLAEAINKKPDIYQRTTDGLTTDVLLANGDVNINTNTLKVEMLTKHVSQTAVQWTQLS
jgi:hypothetical protein